MTPYERVQNALHGKPVDRVPVIFWRHFRPEGSGEKLAELTYEFFVQKFALDIVKIMPDLPYPMPSGNFATAEDIKNLPVFDQNIPLFQEQLRCVKALRHKIGPDYPLIITYFSPLTIMMRWIGKTAAPEVARKHPEAFLEGLQTIARTLQQVFAAVIEAGVSGVFFSCMGATTAHFTKDEYAVFGKPYDLVALEGAQRGWLNIAHIHAEPDQFGDKIYFESFLDYPVSVLSWSDKVTEPSLHQALALTDKCVMGGLYERGAATTGGADAIKSEIDDAIKQTGSRRLILANGCSLPDDVDEQWLHIIREHAGR